MMWRTVYERPTWSTRSLWRDMNRMQRNMDHLLGGTRGPIQAKFPALNAWVNDEGIVVTAEIPGVDPDNLNITVEGEILILSGSRNEDELPEGAQFRRRERGYGDFSRKIELPFEVDTEAVEAHFRNGVLEIVLPRIPEEKPKKITVTVG